MSLPGTISGGDLAPSLGEWKFFSVDPRFLNDVFLGKNFHFCGNIFDNLLFSHRPDFSDFPFFSQIFPIFPMLNVIFDPFLTRKTPFLLNSYFHLHPTTLLL